MAVIMENVLHLVPPKLSSLNPSVGHLMHNFCILFFILENNHDWLFTNREKSIYFALVVGLIIDESTLLQSFTYNLCAKEPKSN